MACSMPFWQKRLLGSREQFGVDLNTKWGGLEIRMLSRLMGELSLVRWAENGCSKIAKASSLAVQICTDSTTCSSLEVRCVRTCVPSLSRKSWNLYKLFRESPKESSTFKWCQYLWRWTQIMILLNALSISEIKCSAKNSCVSEMKTMSLTG